MKPHDNNPEPKPGNKPQEQGASKEFLALMFLMILGMVVVILKAIGLF